jgi:hypothetical protein|tara:strand:- start:7913 stop:8329 length:417 start_codon:yes stop_codon:yes gene_type:complete
MAEIKWLTNGMVDNNDSATTPEFLPEAQQEENPMLTAPVEKENPMKEWLVEYVGNILKPTDGQVTVEMIIHAMGVEFPEFLLTVAEENWMRGYSQALHDAELGQNLINDGTITPTKTVDAEGGIDVSAETTTDNDQEA